ncbi:sulfite exporter TauE/SafE family protein [Bradyrhizobium sp. CCH5-F6]|jgi:uncharacterized protein|uniref:sulfite exporter TauE/SafE family protein n=1 Tax=Bradyrhizobium sp. CCH5-F6 TaxID=1768753 RepID=UPI00076A3142|nr:sulfite exporter TauE/SafE family protein [Bradyrhizobium sp. CCH5-F6]
MHSLLTEAALSAASGVLVGFSLGLVGGGGSILAVPLLVYVVGLNDPHVAIGTSAIAVAVNAAANLVTHARSGNVKWRCATLFASAGVVGAYLGSTLGKIMDGQRLLALFAVLMMVVGGLMLRNRAYLGDPGVRLSKENLPKLIASGLGVGVLSGFFGIGGGFLIVPALVMATGMPMLNAIGSSLVAVAAFGLTTAANYAVSGLIDWQIAFLFVTGGIFGGLIGARLAKSLGARRGLLTSIFSGLIFAVAIYVLFRYLSAT